MNDVAEEKRHIETRLELEFGDGAEHFGDGDLQFPARQVRAQAAMRPVAESQMRGSPIQANLRWRLEGLRVVRAQRGGHGHAIARLDGDAVNFDLLEADSQRGDGRVSAQQLGHADLEFRWITAQFALVLRMSRQMIEVQADIGGDCIEAAEKQIEAMAEYFFVGPRPSIDLHATGIADEVFAGIAAALLDFLEQ